MTFLTPEQKELGRRNFLRALAGTPALVALGAASAMKGPLSGGPVRLGVIGVGGQGRTLVNNVDPAYGDLRALCDINPAQFARADEMIAKRAATPARHYADWREMLQKEDLEAVIIALPLWLHADVTVACLEAGKHVLCEKMMAWDIAGCERMLQASERSGRLLEIGYQRQYNPVYQAAYEGIVRSGQLGDVYHARLVWHRNANWRRKGDPPSPDYDPSQLGLPDVGTPAELAAVLEVFEGPLRRAREPSGQRGQLVLRRRPRQRHRVRRRPPLQRRPRGVRPHLRHVRLSRRPHGARTPRSNRTRSRIATRSSSGRKRRCSSREKRKRCSSTRAASSAQPASR